MIPEEEIKKAAIKNAAMHNGEARIGSVISEILGKDKQLVKEMDNLKALAEKAVKEVNSQGKEEIMKLAVDMKLLNNKENEKEKKESRKSVRTCVALMTLLKVLTSLSKSQSPKQ